MKYSSSLTQLSALFAITLFAGWVNAELPMHEKDCTLYEKPIGDGTSLVVVRDPDQDLTSLSFWKRHHVPDGVDPTWVERINRLYVIRVELRKDGQQPLLLATSLRGETDTPAGNGFDVYDCLLDKEGLTLGVSSGTTLYFWRIQFGKLGSEWHRFKANRGWESMALAVPWSRENLSLTFKRNAQDCLLVSLMEWSDHKVEFVETKPGTFEFTITSEERKH